MKRNLLALAALGLFAFGCDSPTATTAESADLAPEFTVIGGDNPNGSIVLNKGEASEPFGGSCFFSGRVTTDVTLVRNPNGRALLSCHWADFPAPPQEKALIIKDFTCTLNYFGTSVTNKSHFVLNKGGGANMHCTFDEVL